jgi:hypothetical protein
MSELVGQRDIIAQTVYDFKLKRPLAKQVLQRMVGAFSVRIRQAVEYVF